MIPHRPLGVSGLDVSVLSLGSWRTFERIPHDRGVAVMRQARESGITFLDDARYDDETGTAPLATGYSEVVFGRLFRDAGWRRDEVVVANKLWWEFWPQESAAAELDGSLDRMGFDHFDLVYAARPPEGMSMAELVGMMGELVAGGKIRAWGALNWAPQLLGEAAEIARRAGKPAPCATQVGYNVALREPVESAAAEASLDETGVAVVASMPLWYGALTGKYARGEDGRIAETLGDAQYADALRAAEWLRVLARELDTTSAALAIAFPLLNPRVASVLFGATRPEQVAENARALDVLELGGDALDRLRAL